MRALVTLALFFISVQMNAQEDEALVETTIENFFNAFHRQDSVGIKMGIIHMVTPMASIMGICMGMPMRVPMGMSWGIAIEVP